MKTEAQDVLVLLGDTERRYESVVGLIIEAHPNWNAHQVHDYMLKLIEGPPDKKQRQARAKALSKELCGGKPYTPEELRDTPVTRP